MEDANCVLVLCSGQCIATALQRSNLCPLCKASLKPNKATIPNHFRTLVHTRTHRQSDTDHTHTLPVNPTQCCILSMLTFSEPACAEVRQAPGEGPSSECPSMSHTTQAPRSSCGVSEGTISCAKAHTTIITQKQLVLQTSELKSVFASVKTLNAKGEVAPTVRTYMFREAHVEEACSF